MTNEELQEALQAEREARIRAEGERDGFARALAIVAEAAGRDAAAERKRAYDREYQRSRTISRESHEPPSPLLEGSPPPSVPSSPPPISSPRPPIAPESQSALPGLTAPDQRSPREAKPKRRREPTGDPRHHPLLDRLVIAFRETTQTAYGFRKADARAVSELLALADQDKATAGDAACVEVERRWRIGLAWTWGNGEKPVQNLLALVRLWNDCAQERAPPGGNRFVSASSATHAVAGDVDAF